MRLVSNKYVVMMIDVGPIHGFQETFAGFAAAMGNRIMIPDGRLLPDTPCDMMALLGSLEPMLTTMVACRLQVSYRQVTFVSTRARMYRTKVGISPSRTWGGAVEIGCKSPYRSPFSVTFPLLRRGIFSSTNTSLWWADPPGPVIGRCLFLSLDIPSFNAPAHQ